MVYKRLITTEKKFKNLSKQKLKTSNPDKFEPLLIFNFETY